MLGLNVNTGVIFLEEQFCLMGCDIFRFLTKSFTALELNIVRTSPQSIITFPPVKKSITLLSFYIKIHRNMYLL